MAEKKKETKEVTAGQKRRAIARAKRYAEQKKK